mmetsp:Transcript_17210/g.55085  ORF Transcript_17210/g.55085 Transcript_17210/m.55085 type:complete len:204 (+) Transcript_17210:1464-2075(+)
MVVDGDRPLHVRIRFPFTAGPAQPPRIPLRPHGTRGVDGGERASGQAGVGKLVDVHARLNTLQGVGPVIDHLEADLFPDVFRDLVEDIAAHEDLPAVACLRDPRRMIHVGPEVLGAPRPQTRPHLDGAPSRGPHSEPRPAVDQQTAHVLQAPHRMREHFFSPIRFEEPSLHIEHPPHKVRGVVERGKEVALSLVHFVAPVLAQ